MSWGKRLENIPAKVISLLTNFPDMGGVPGFIAPMALMAQPEEKHPKTCIACRNCEAVCPQQIKISDTMADFAAKLG